MKILLAFPQRDGQTGPAIKFALNKLGHIVTSCEPSNIGMHIGDYDLVFCSRTPSIAQHIHKFDCKTAMWNVDAKHNINSWGKLIPLVKKVDVHFTVALQQLEEWKHYNTNTLWLPQGLQNEIYDKVKGHVQPEFDITFCGRLDSVHSFRAEYLDCLTSSHLKFKHFGQRGEIYNLNHNILVAKSRINLGMSGWVDLGCPSVRNYKILGAGGLLFERYHPSIAFQFPVCIFYENPSDLINKATSILKDDAKRKDMAELGYQWVHQTATYTHRMKQALEMIF
jgi:hypothetical protein